jgi:hypothetical protein
VGLRRLYLHLPVLFLLAVAVAVHTKVPQEVVVLEAAEALLITQPEVLEIHPTHRHLKVAMEVMATLDKIPQWLLAAEVELLLLEGILLLE